MLFPWSILLFCGIISLSAQKKQGITVKRSIDLMGCTFEFTVIAPNEEIGSININEAAAEIERIDALISSWKSTSETNLINQNAGIKPVKVSFELFTLVQKSKQVSVRTNGAFDISFAALKHLWNTDGGVSYVPEASKISDALKRVGHEKIILDPDKQTIFLKDKGMKIEFGGNGIGYAIDKAKALLISNQVTAGMIKAAGHITSWGARANGKKWFFGMSNTFKNPAITEWMPLVESSVVTSNSMRKYVVFKERKYSHILDPRTGYPAAKIMSVSVFAKDAELCDALATAICVLGKDRGLALINELGEAEVVIIDLDGQLHSSNGIQLKNGK